MSGRGAFQKYIKPCPENGVSHDCSHEYVMWMPVEALDAALETEGVQAASGREFDPDGITVRARGGIELLGRIVKLGTFNTGEILDARDAMQEMLHIIERHEREEAK